MPLVRGLEVNVQTKNGTLPEYGTIRLRSGAVFSTFIQSEDNTPFQINFRPSNLFTFSKPLGSKRDQHMASSRPTIWKPQEARNWDFSAHIFIDDNPKADKNLIIDLPRNGETFGAVTARGRSCVDSDGNSAEQHWMFNEIPIEDQLAKLTTNEKVEDEWEMVSDPGTGDSTKSCTKMGQIKIQLFRIRQRGVDRARKPERRSEVPQGQSQTNTGNEISHTVGVGEARPRIFHYITVDYLDGPKVPWATIIFMYRGKKQLQKMGLIPEKNPVNLDRFRTFGPSPSTQFGASQMTSGKYNERFNDPDSPPKKQGVFSAPSPDISPIFSFSEENSMSGPNIGKCDGLPLFGTGDLISRATPRLKRKPDRETEISASLSAMSLSQKGHLVLQDLASYNNSRKKSAWESKEEESTDDEMASLKRVKIKRFGPDGDEEILL